VRYFEKQPDKTSDQYQQLYDCKAGDLKVPVTVFGEKLFQSVGLLSISFYSRFMLHDDPRQLFIVHALSLLI